MLAFNFSVSFHCTS